MAQRLDRPITFIREFSGPVRLGRFDENTLIVAGPNDEPIIIRHGSIMTLKANHPNGDLEFSYEFFNQQFTQEGK